MTLKRTTIRQYVQTALLNKTAAGARVYDTKLTPIFKSDLPAINIVTPSETNDLKTAGHSRVSNSLRVELQVWALVSASTSENIGTKLDSLCEQIHTYMDKPLGGNVQCAEYQDTQIQFDPDGENTTATAVITYDVLFLQ